MQAPRELDAKALLFFRRPPWELSSTGTLRLRLPELGKELAGLAGLFDDVLTMIASKTPVCCLTSEGRRNLFSTADSRTCD
jgi:hypothetical protein